MAAGGHAPGSEPGNLKPHQHAAEKAWGGQGSNSGGSTAWAATVRGVHLRQHLQIQAKNDLPRLIDLVGI